MFDSNRKPPSRKSHEQADDIFQPGIFYTRNDRLQHVAGIGFFSSAKIGDSSYFRDLDFLNSYEIPSFASSTDSQQLWFPNKK